MELLYDIEQSNGDIVSGVYFVKYALPIRGGKNNVRLIYSDVSICAYDKNDKKVPINLLDASITKVYDAENGIDYTEMMINKHEEVEKIYGGRLPFPFARRTEEVELISQ